MAGLQFAEVGAYQRVVGNKVVGRSYEKPEGWSDQLKTGWKAGGKESDDANSVLFVVQPDSSLDLSPAQCMTHTYVQMFNKTEDLVEVLQKLSAEEIRDLMGLGNKMAKGHLERFQSFEKLPPKQACLLFGGKVLNAAEFNEGDRKFAQEHLRIVSGLYGVLRPYDDVKPVRDVPMGGKLATKKGKTILDFWGDSIQKQLGKDAAGTTSGKVLLVACVNEEYLPAVTSAPYPKEVRLVNCLFDSGPAEQARIGREALAHHVIKNRVSNLHGLREFEHDDWS